MTLDFTLLRSVRVPSGVYVSTDLEALANFVLTAEDVPGTASLTLELTSPERIQSLNRHFRGVDRNTDVIAFRYTEPPELEGDIAINTQQAQLQAKKLRHPWPREVRLLLIHGILHLLDYTDYDPIPRRKMFKRQNELLRRWEKQHPFQKI